MPMLVFFTNMTSSKLLLLKLVLEHLYHSYYSHIKFTCQLVHHVCWWRTPTKAQAVRECRLCL